jgi:hypothetical protein
MYTVQHTDQCHILMPEAGTRNFFESAIAIRNFFTEILLRDATPQFRNRNFV